VVAGKSLTAVEPRQPLESHQFKVDGSQMVSGSVVHPVEATARSKSLRPVQVVITLKVPCVLCLTPATCRLPDVSQATRHPTNLLQLYTTSNVTDRQTDRHSSSCRTLAFPHTRTTRGDRSSAVVGPRMWNSLPAALRQITSYGQFRQHPKTHLFGA